MALDNQFGKGIGVAAGFDLGAQKPLDARVAVNTIAERDAHVENNRAYEGMLVYVAEANMTYQLVKGEEEGQLVWKEFGFNQNDFDESFNGAIQDVDDRLKAIEEDLAQGGETEARIAQAESDIDGLQGLVGQPAQAAEGEGEEGVPATGLHLAVQNAQEQADKGVADAAAEKLRAEGQEAAIRQELADAIAQEVEDRDAAILVEKERAEGVEQGLAGRLDVIEGEGEGSIKKAVKDLADRHDQEMQDAADQVAEDLAALKEELQGEIDADVAAEAKLRDDADKALDERVKPLEAHVAAQPGVDAAQDARIKALEDDKPLKEAAIQAAQDAADQAQREVDAVEERATDLEGRMDVAEEDIARLDGAVDVEGSVKKQIKDAVDAINADAEALEARVKANEDDIAEINGVIGVPAGEGVEATGMHKLIADEDARILGEAKAHAEQKIADLIDSAPDAMNTLNELAEAINANKGVYDAYIEQHAQAMAQQKADLQAEIDADVKVEKERAEGKEAELQGEIDAAEGRLDALEAKVGHDKVEGEAPQDATGLFLEVDQARAAADAIEKRLDDEGGLVDRLEAAEAFVQGHSHEALQNEIDALEGRADALEAFVEAHDHSVMEQGIANNAAAIEAEVKEGGARDAAIEAALEAYSTTDEVKAILGNVVNSLALTMENNQVVLKLGGVDGIALTSVQLDVVTDDDIDAIIDGLDTVEGE